jgi:hypothetical protein
MIMIRDIAKYIELMPNFNITRPMAKWFQVEINILHDGSRQKGTKLGCLVPYNGSDLIWCFKSAGGCKVLG